MSLRIHKRLELQVCWSHEILVTALAPLQPLKSRFAILCRVASRPLIPPSNYPFHRSPGRTDETHRLTTFLAAGLRKLGGSLHLRV